MYMYKKGVGVSMSSISSDHLSFHHLTHIQLCANYTFEQGMNGCFSTFEYTPEPYSDSKGFGRDLKAKNKLGGNWKPNSAHKSKATRPIESYSR
mmetsp:Transcript_8582/g.23007  ORF Transcript_8582/g.23007 Transcript_8582/m.23007 type:complete len:94 (+) Transcript_8582:1303-1584(+)